MRASEIDKRAQNQWWKARISYHYCEQYVLNKEDRYKLELFDLLLVKNFKGGSATVNEPTEGLKCKLQQYERKLRAIANAFENRSLRSLNTRSEEHTSE